jgi:membrane-bound lytic murein transglycosylase B
MEVVKVKYSAFRRLALICIVVLLGMPQTLQAETLNPEPQTDSWQSCVATLRASAVNDGVSAETVDEVLGQVTQLPRVIQLDRKQPEFTQTFTQYYELRVTDFRVTQGRNLLAKHAPLLARIQAATGVPPQYLVAFWGLETNFGSYFGKLPIPSALTTLACDSRRSEFFTRELIAILRIIEAGDIEHADLIGSWAGAIGHMQFMPTTYLEYAVDGDADGRRDLLGSVADALTSGGSYLASIGWQEGYRWGREVFVPEGFDFSVTGSEQWRPLSEWADLGITDVFGVPLEAVGLEAALVVPSGHQGPAFLIYPNFRIIMKWNRSEHYALSVGRLADRIAGAGKLHKPLPSAEQSRFSTTTMMGLQSGLNALGYAAGEPDGVIGPATRKAIRSFQQQVGQIADGYPTAALITAVNQAVASQKL